jgi:hypothetical protein
MPRRRGEWATQARSSAPRGVARLARGLGVAGVRSRHEPRSSGGAGCGAASRVTRGRHGRRARRVEDGARLGAHRVAGGAGDGVVERTRARRRRGGHSSGARAPTSPTMCLSAASAVGGATRAARRFSASKGRGTRPAHGRLPSGSAERGCHGRSSAPATKAPPRGCGSEHALGLERTGPPAGRARRRKPRPDALAGRRPRRDAAGGDGIADLADDVIERAHALRGDECGDGGRGLGHCLTAPE